MSVPAKSESNDLSTVDVPSRPAKVPAAKNPEFMESRSIPRLLVQFSTPAIIASLVSVTYNLVARIFVAQRFGMDGVAAVTVAFPVIVMFLAVAMTIGTGATIIISIRLGERDNDKAEEALGQALFLSAITAALFIFFGQLFLEPILRFVGATGDASDPNSVFSLAKSYLSVVIWGVFTQHIAYGVNNFVRAEGKPMIAMVSMLLSAVINAILDYYFLFVLRTGIWGAGLANVIACAVAAGWICYLYFSGKTILRWRWRYISRFDWKLTKTIAVCGAVPFATQVCSGVLQTTQNNLLGHYGDLYGAARGYSFDGGDLAIGIMGTVVAISSTIIMPFLGLGQGVQPIVGYNSGAGRPDRVLATIKLALKVAVVAAAIAWAFLMSYPEAAVKWFLRASEEGYAEKLALGVIAVRSVCVALPLIAVNVLASGYFQAQGRPILALMMTLVRQLFFLLPCLIVSTWLFERFLGYGKGLNGCWFSFPAADFVGFVVAVVFLRADFKRLKARMKEREEKLRAAANSNAIEDAR
ncbi:MAG: MATE family efflux transporter [Thermoguttaceae bacterium]|nr:MATE family efflux transporter [Thermoguttaceae bacterium]